MTLSDQDRKELAKVRIENARATLEDAKRLIVAGSLRGAANRAYYSMFYAASALAISRGVVLSKHSALIAFFQKEYVKTGLLDRKHGRALQKAFEDRSEADYQDFVKFTTEQMQRRVEDAAEFIRTVETFLGIERTD